MPFPPNPPPVGEAGAIISPRQLNRWLDTNQVNVLTRTETYITVPAFSINYTWRGYSELVTSWNYEASHNFTLKRSQNVLPLSPNYMLCVMWEDQNRNVHRYALWQDVDEVIYFNIPLYTGQQIKANFRFEVWTVSSSVVASQVTDLVFYTSVRGNYDYIWQTDTPLVISDGLVTNFAQTLTIPDPPSDVNNLLVNRFRSTDGFATPDWDSMVDNTTITSADAVAVDVASGANAFKCIKTTGAALTGALSGNPTINYLGLVAYIDGSTGNLLTYDGRPLISVTPTHINIGGTFTPLNGVNKLYFVQLVSPFNVAFIIDIKLWPAASQVITAYAAPVPSTTLSVLSAGCTCGILEILAYNSLADFNGLYAYVRAKYGGFTLPLTFPADSVPQLNTI